MAAGPWVVVAAERQADAAEQLRAGQLLVEHRLQELARVFRLVPLLQRLVHLMRQVAPVDVAVWAAE